VTATPVTEWTGFSLDAYDERKRLANEDGTRSYYVEERSGGLTGREYRVVSTKRPGASS
jgi:hypothetical protein